MNVSDLKHYKTKAEIQAQDGRHRRTLGNDVSTAIRLQNTELLELCALLIKPDEVVKGIDVTSKLLSSLKKNKKTAVWYFLPEFVTAAKKVNSNSAIGSKPEPTAHTAGSETSSTQEPNKATGADTSIINKLPSQTTERLAALELLNAKLVEDLEYERNRSETMLKLVEQLPELQKQSNTLMQSVQRQLQQGIATSNATPDVASSKSPEMDVQEARAAKPTVEVVQSTAVATKKKATRKASKKKATKKSAPENKSIFTRDIRSFFSRK